MRWFLRLFVITLLLNLCLIVTMCLRGHLQASGQYIAYTLVDENHDPHIMLYDFATGITLELTTPTEQGRLYGRTPQWSPDGSRIAYRTYRNRSEIAVYEFDVQHFTDRNLTDLFGTISLPIYARDERLTFINSPGGFNSTLEQVHPEREPAAVIEGIGGVPAWSPDGRYLAYLALEQRDTEEAFSEDTRRQSNLTEIDVWLLDTLTDERQPLTMNVNTHGAPQWSPDGRKIAFRSVETPVGDVFIIDLETGAVKRHNIVIFAAPDLSWSPDSRHLAVSTADGTDNLDVHQIDVETGELTRLTLDPAYDLQPTWSADGEWIAFVSRRAGQVDLYAVHLASGRVQRLTHTELNEADPVWQPR